MGDLPRDQADEPLRADGVKPYERVWAPVRRTLRAAPVIGALGAYVIAIWALSAAVGGFADTGVESEAPGGVVLAVSPTGSAWRDGIRPGQVVVSLTPSDDAAGWGITTTDPGGRLYASSQAPMDQSLRDSVPVAFFAVLLGVIALALAWKWPSGSRLSAMFAVLFAATPLTVQGDPLLSTVALAAALILPAGWAIGRIRNTPAAVVATLGLSVGVIAWTVARLGGSDVTALEQVRSAASLVLCAAALVWIVLVPAVRRNFTPSVRVRTVDLLSVGLAVGVCVALVFVVHVPPVVVGSLLAAAVLVYPTTRHTATVGADRLLLSGLRETAALQATERERTRVAFELHDAPMQELSGVIRRLDLLPDAQAESDALRGVAQQLRTVASGLRPPQLDDLGLVPALSYLAERSSTPSTEVTVQVADRTTLLPDQRLPPEVELELYRIAEEATHNALAHAHPGRVLIDGFVSPSNALIQVRDDGVGLSDNEMEDARRRGRMGVVSMRRRAATIGADLRISSAGQDCGTLVWVSWHR